MLTLVSRDSPLAVLQVDEALQSLTPLFPDTKFNRVDTSTIGDVDQVTPLTDAAIPQDYFTREVDQILLTGNADIGVHSAKDLPDPLHPDLIVAALLPVGEIRDTIVFREDWPEGQAPAVVGTSSPRREEEIRKLYPDVDCRSIRGTIARRLEQLDAGDYDAVIIAACALHRLDLSHRIGPWLPGEPTPQQGRLALVVRKDRADLITALRAIDIRQNAGMVALVGIPADHTLLSDRARRYLEAADVILADRLIPDEVGLACHDRLETVGKVGREPSIPQEDIHRRMLDEAQKGRLVVRCQGGDPSILGQLASTLEFCTQWHLRFDLVPGVTSSQVAAAHAGTPLTDRVHGRAITMMSGHHPDTYLPAAYAGPESGNRAIYMGAGDAPRIKEKLQDAGWPDDTAITIGQRLGFSDELHQHLPLAELGTTPIATPAVILVGPTGHPPGPVTLFTGTDPEPFLRHGPLQHLPFIRLVALSLESRKSLWQKHGASVDGIIFPSRFAVHAFMEVILAEGDVRDLHGKKILAVGPATADELTQFGLKADVTAPGFGGAAALANLLRDNPIGKTLLYPCSDASPTEKRKAAMAEAGVDLVPESFYANREIFYKALPERPYSRVLFTSSSTATAYFTQFPEEKTADRVWLAVGTSTLHTLEALGLSAAILPAKKDLP